MNWEVFITCAVTGVGETVERSDRVPVIAESTLEAARAGAAIVHIHVRDPDTGKGACDPRLYRDVLDRLRSSDVDVVVNLTTGMGGDLVLGSDETPLPFDDAGTDMAGATERLEHIAELKPEICTLDCGSQSRQSSFGGGDVPPVREMIGVRPQGGR